MTSLLEQAIKQLRELSKEEQDAAADVLFVYISSEERHHRLLPHQITQVKRIRQDLGEGKTRLATPGEVSAAKKKYAV
jgi:hypothetical protein